MKPCSGDIRHKLLIAGDELTELERPVHAIAEASGLDCKIEASSGLTPKGSNNTARGNAPGMQNPPNDPAL